MIYSNNNDPLVLTEGAADAFLESVGVELFEDEIAIDGTLYEGAYGESILEANGIFLYEDGIVLEGERAEKYLKDKKAKKEIFARHRADIAKSRLKTATDRAEISRKTSHALADKKADEKGYDNNLRMGMHKAIDSSRDKRIDRANSKYKKQMGKIQKKYGINIESTIFSDIEII